MSSERPPSQILTHDVNRLLQYLHDLDELRGNENKELGENIKAIKDELMDLSDYLRNKPAEPAPEAPPPPVPRKDRSVDASASVVSRPLGPREGPVPRVNPRMIPIPLTPPPMRYRPSSPSSLSDSASFLSSHHSDDFSLMETDVYPRSASPSWSSSSFTSTDVSSEESEELEVSEALETPEDLTVHEEIVEPETPERPAEVERPVAVDKGRVFQSPSPEGTVVSSPEQTVISSTPVSESLLSSGEYMSGSSSPSLSDTASSRTARPSPDTHLRDLLDQLKDQTSALRDGQDTTNEVLDEIRRRGTAPEVIQCVDKLGRLEDLLQNLLDQMPRSGPAPQPPRESAAESLFDSGSDTSSSINRLREMWDELNQARREPPTIYMPTPIRMGPSLEDQMADMLSTAPPPQTVPVQAPPTLIPLIYRPVPRATRPRSASPTSFVDLPRRSSSVPIPDTFDVFGTGQPPRRARYTAAMPPRGSRRSRFGPEASSAVGDLPPSQAPSGVQGQGARPPRSEGPDINFLDELRRHREQRGRSGFFSARAPAPVMVSTI